MGSLRRPCFWLQLRAAHRRLCPLLQGLTTAIRGLSVLGLPIYITETGVADAGDSLRPQMIQTYMAEVRAVVGGWVRECALWVCGCWGRGGICEVGWGGGVRGSEFVRRCDGVCCGYGWRSAVACPFGGPVPWHSANSLLSMHSPSNMHGLACTHLSTTPLPLISLFSYTHLYGLYRRLRRRCRRGTTCGA